MRCWQPVPTVVRLEILSYLIDIESSKKHKRIPGDPFLMQIIKKSVHAPTSHTTNYQLDKLELVCNTNTRSYWVKF
ncbi:MAG: hypothetical protein RJB21_884 [Pseudomonadota bacterium]|jgi:hypothetical protein